MTPASEAAIAQTRNARKPRRITYPRRQGWWDNAPSFESPYITMETDPLDLQEWRQAAEKGEELDMAPADLLFTDALVRQRAIVFTNREILACRRLSG